MKHHSIKRVYEICIFVGLIVLVGFRLFYKLGNGALNVTDEAWYGVNAYEMFKSGNFLVPTLRHQVDYASKPPLGLWWILIGFKLFGVNLVGLRMYSAVAGLLTICLICIYLLRRCGLRNALVAAAVFAALWQCFELHMYRSGDMDALFCFFYALAIISLAEVTRGLPHMFIAYGCAVGLGFMTKSMHVTVFLIVGILYLPVIWHKLKAKDIVLAIVAGLLPNVIWIIARYPVDGFKYILSITFGEADDQTRAGITFDYLRDISREKVTWVLVAVLVTRIVLFFVGFATDKREDAERLSFRTLYTYLFDYCKSRYFLILAVLVPIVFYTLAGHYMIWYIDPAYIAMVCYIAIETPDTFDRLKAYIGKLGVILPYGVIAFCILYACLQIWQYRGLGTGGGAIEQFGHDMIEFRTETAGKYDGYKAYIAYDRERHVGNRGHWELDFVFLGNANAGLECVDGGVEGFLADENSLLVLDSNLWSEYSNVLTGYVFLEQNSYYVLSHDRY